MSNSKKNSKLVQLKVITTWHNKGQSDKSKGLAAPLAGKETAATTHGLLRQMVGFDLNHLARALRASVIRLWKAQVAGLDDSEFYEMMRFNEAIDQALAESIASCSNAVNRSRQTFLAVLGSETEGTVFTVRIPRK